MGRFAALHEVQWYLLVVVALACVYMHVHDSEHNYEIQVAR